MSVVPEQADTVIIGGGVVGLATAYHLAAAGAGSVVLVEKDAFGSGSTTRSAGGVRAQFSDEINVRLGQHGLRVFERFAELFGQEIDFHQVGYLFLLDNPADVATFEASVAMQNSLGVPSRMISPAEAQRLSPLISTDGLLAAAFSPEDGHCDPSGVCQGYASAARRRGATLVSGCPATGADVDRSGTTPRVRAVHTRAGSIRTERVIIAAGAWSKQVGSWFGVDLPVEPLRRQILVTEPVSGLRGDTPMTIDFATTFYFHNEGPGLLMGMSDPDETPGFKLTPDQAWLPGLIEAMSRRTPSLEDVGIATQWAGLYEVTPDANGLVGQFEEVPGVFYCTGFSGHGFLLGPALGEVMTSLVRGDEPFVDVSGFDVARFAGDDLRPEINIV
ncbi:MAG TPA: FAD-binding oxidoreductase [Intrasporangiaceae bacterium]|nr:FAD-binding oxidoreductase [Intrasporangiaceae bacterium]